MPRKKKAVAIDAADREAATVPLRFSADLAKQMMEIMQFEGYKTMSLLTDEMFRTAIESRHGALSPLIKQIQDLKKKNGGGAS